MFGFLAAQARIPSVDNGVPRLAFGVIQPALDRRVARAGLQALELGWRIVHEGVWLTPLLTVSIVYGNDCGPFAGQQVGDPAFFGREGTGPLVYDPLAHPVYLTPGHGLLPLRTFGGGQGQAGVAILATESAAERIKVGPAVARFESRLYPR